MQDCEVFSPVTFVPGDLGIWITIGLVRNVKHQIHGQMILGIA
jgi:hypothetical protein